jgi:plastocyanin
MKRTARKRLGLSLVAGLAAISFSFGAVSAQTPMADQVSHPAHIHDGGCPTPGDVVYPLNNLTGSGGASTSTSTADTTIDDLLAAPHAIVVHESDENIGNYLVCGDVVGTPEADGTLIVGLAALGDNTAEGVAYLSAGTDGGINVTVYLNDDASVTGMAMPAASDAHPSHIHNGDCTAPADVVYPLSDVVPAASMADAQSLAVETGFMTVDTTLDELTATPHSIVAHLSADEIGTYLVCGDITAATDGMIVTPLKELAGSGYAGVAVLQEADAGGVNVWVILFPGVNGMGMMASPEADMGGMDMDHSSMGTPESGDMGGMDMGGEAVTATIEGFAFNPGNIEVAAGTTVTWTNNDSTAHTVTADDGSFQSGRLEQGDTFSYTFDTAGTFSYHCEYHANMTATVTVS